MWQALPRVTEPVPFGAGSPVQERGGATRRAHWGRCLQAGPLPRGSRCRFFVAGHYAAHYRTFTTSLAWVSGTSGIATKLSAEHSFSLPLARGFSGHTDLAPHYDARSGTLLRPKLPGSRLSRREGASVRHCCFRPQTPRAGL